MDAGGAIPREGHGRYELLHRLAIGGMGEVFIARWRGTASVHRLVALKRLLPERAEQPGSLEMFVDQARIAACIPHPNIVGILDFGNERGTYYLTMELVAGQNLERIATRGRARGRPLPRVQPRRLTFALRLDKFGRVLEASLAEPTGIGSVTAACLHTWLLRWPFRSAEREASDHLEVTVR